jgi:hypothetical protein
LFATGAEAIAALGLLLSVWLWISGSILAGYVAAAKGRSGLWIFTALFVSPLLALVALAGVPDVKGEKDTVDAVDEGYARRRF